MGSRLLIEQLWFASMAGLPDCLPSFTYCKTKMDFGNFLELTYERDRPRPCSLCKEFDSPKKEIKYIMNDKRTLLNLQNLSCWCLAPLHSMWHHACLDHAFITVNSFAANIHLHRHTQKVQFTKSCRFAEDLKQTRISCYHSQYELTELAIMQLNNTAHFLASFTILTTST